MLTALACQCRTETEFKNANPFALLRSRWAYQLIHSHVWALNKRKSWYIRASELSMSEKGCDLRSGWSIESQWIHRIRRCDCQISTRFYSVSAHSLKRDRKNGGWNDNCKMRQKKANCWLRTIIGGREYYLWPFSYCREPELDVPLACDCILTRTPHSFSNKSPDRFAYF